MDYSVVEGKKLNSINYECEGYRYVKFRECENSIYLRCALFRKLSCPSIAKVDKITNIFRTNSSIHNFRTNSSTF